MTCGDGCCGGDDQTSVPMEPPSPLDVLEANGSRCCPDSDVRTDACCDDECLRLVALQQCTLKCGVPNHQHSNAGPPDDRETERTSCKSGQADCCRTESGACAEKNPVVSKSCCDTDDSHENTESPEGCKAGCCGSKTPSKSPKAVCPQAAGWEQNGEQVSVGPVSEVSGHLAKCQEAKRDCCTKTTESSEGETSRTEPCGDHLEAARRRYGNMFGAMSCMCKALLAQGLESCCTTKRKLSSERISNAPMSRNREKRCSSNYSGTSTAIEVAGSSAQSLSVRRAGTFRQERPDLKGAAHDPGSVSDKRLAEKCQSDGCEPTTHSDTSTAPKAITQIVSELVPSSNDLERGGSPVEHIVLSVQGMTCTGCETKLQRSIKAISSATNAQASIVLSRAEFDIDPRIITAEQSIAQLERATGFTLTKLSTAGNELHVQATMESNLIMSKKTPLGVIDVRRLDVDTIGICYDANVVGARELLDKSFEFKLHLAPLRPPANIAADARHVRHVGIMTILSTTLTIPVLVFAWAPLPEHETAYQSASLALATVVQVVIAGSFYSSALRSLVFSKVIEMDLLIVLSTSAAYIFSVVAYAYFMIGKPLSTSQFFESSTLLVTLIMIGRFISALARHKAVESVSVTSLQPSTAVLVDEEHNDIEEVDSRLLHYADVFKVAPDSRIVTDGTVVSGASEVDESMITGESKLVAKRKGSSVVAGSINGPGLLHVKVARLPGENTINSIADMVDQAKLSKPRIQEFADKVAGYFVPVTVTITVVVFCIWIAIGIVKRHQSSSDAVVKALTYAIAVLIVSCPCAVGLAVPMVIVISCGVGAEQGIVFKSAQSIETSWRVTHVVFDKTGTLTQGNASVVKDHRVDTGQTGALSLLLGLASGNKHPISVALAKHLMKQGLEATALDSLATVVGKGVEGRKTGKLLQVGNPRWLGLENLPQVRAYQLEGLTTLCFAIDHQPQSIFGLADTLRPEAKSVVSALMSRGIAVSIVSGDESGPVESIGGELGLDSTKLRSRCSPQDKQQYIQDLTDDKKNIVIFCGDGSNDAGALAQATVGVHMSEGTDIARSASDAVLMKPDISGLLKLMAISRAAFRRIVLNFVWAGVYNLFAILLAAGAFVNFRIQPEYAGLGEVVSVLPVIVIALQMKWARF